MIIGAFVGPLVLFCGVVTAIAAITGDPPATPAADSATPSPSPSPSPGPLVVVRTVVEVEEIPFDEVVEQDASLLKGTREVRQEGRPGLLRITYEVTYTDGVETGRRKVKEEVTRPARDHVVVEGTGEPPPPPPASDPKPPPSDPKPPPSDSKPPSNPKPPPRNDCHPSYTGACVPFASDVDCAGGGGDGPAYVRGPVYVVGPDVYDLDRDGDGVACER